MIHESVAGGARVVRFRFELLAPWLIVALALSGLGCERRRAPSPPRASRPLAAGAAAASADDGQWPMPAHDYAATRYSAQDQINAGNVSTLKLDWTFSTGVLKGHEAAPLVVGATMYIVTPYPNILYALDLRRPGGPLKWVYRPKPSAAAQGVACCDVVNRGAAWADGRIFYNTLDDHTVALDAETGKELWKTQVGDINHGEFGVRGWLAALDAGSGRLV